MSSSKRDRSPSVEVTNPHSAAEKNPEEDEFTENAQELIIVHEEVLPEFLHFMCAY